MKELSIEQKVKAYDKALERARKIKEGGSGYIVGLMEDIFPALKESEDEKTRKAIIEFFELQDDDTTYSFIPKKDILAWLEKQGEQKESSCDRCKRAQPSHSCQDITELGRCYLEHEKQGEQNQLKKVEQEYHCNGVREPKEATGVLKQLLDKENYVWSEEDKVKINRIVAFLENLNLKYLNVAGNDILLKDIEWLKSLKNKYVWKPSEENNVDKS